MKIKLYKLRITNNKINNKLSIALNKEFYFKCLVYIIIDIDTYYINKNIIEDENKTINKTFLNSYFKKIFNLFENKINYNLNKNNNYNLYKMYDLINEYYNSENENKVIKNYIDNINKNECNDIVKMIINIKKPNKKQF